MSHISKIEMEINDLDALKQACTCMGLEFLENEPEFTYYGGKGSSLHAVQVPGANYSLGVVKKDNNFELLWDDYMAGGLKNILGENASLLKKNYSLARIKNEARKKRYHVQEQKITGGTRLILTT